MKEAISGAGIQFPEAADYRQWQARQYFVERLSGIGPEGPLEHLRTVVYPKYRQAREEGHPLLSAWIWTASGSIRMGPVPPVISEFLTVLENWALKFRLNQGFIYEAVLHSFDRWFQLPGVEQALEYRERPGMLAGATAAKVTSSLEWLPGYDSKSVARRKYLARAARDFDEAAARWEGTGVRFDPEILQLFTASQLCSESASFIATAFPRVDDCSVIRRKLRKAERLLGWRGRRFCVSPGRRPTS